MKTNKLKFYTRTTIVALLGTIGLLALTGEPAEDANFVAVVAAQVGTAAACWGTAWWLAKRWQLTRVLRLISRTN